MRGSAVFAVSGLNIKPGIRLKINLNIADQPKNQLNWSKNQSAPSKNQTWSIRLKINSLRLKAHISTIPTHPSKNQLLRIATEAHNPSKYQFPYHTYIIRNDLQKSNLKVNQSKNPSKYQYTLSYPDPSKNSLNIAKRLDIREIVLRTYNALTGGAGISISRLRRYRVYAPLKIVLLGDIYIICSSTLP